MQRLDLGAIPRAERRSTTTDPSASSARRSTLGPFKPVSPAGLLIVDVVIERTPSAPPPRVAMSKTSAG
jgi:hypothetical protein